MTSSGNKLTVVFFGSGPVAAESLLLLKDHCDVEAIITKPATVKDMTAIANGQPVYSINNKAELDDLISSKSFDSKLGVLIDFGIIVSRHVIDSFEKGIINSHFSLLPQWRGADPISFAILSGQSKTGVSLMLIDENMDTGKLLVQKSMQITASETTPSLTQRLITLSNTLMKQYLNRYVDGTAKARQQPHPDRATYSRKLTKKDGVLDFSKSATTLEREIRAFLDWPKSRTEIAGKDVIILSAKKDMEASGNLGEIFKTNDKKIGIYCSQGALIIERLKPAGKKAMTSQAFLAGNTI